MSKWFREKAIEDWAQTFQFDEVILNRQSGYQKIDILNTKRFGKVLLLDEIVQCTEKDEFAYHEMMVHVPINAYGDARSVLIIGGGDGGILEEVLKHSCVKSVTMVEIDNDVVTACKAFLPSICKNAFDDPRTHLVIADAVTWIETSTDKFDIIIVDRSDMTGPAVGLYNKDFYQKCKALMTPEGIFVAQTGVLAFNQSHLASQLGLASQVWKKTGFYLSVVPTYAGGFITIMWTADWNITCIDPQDKILGLQYYNVDMHKAAFALPTFAREL